MENRFDRYNRYRLTMENDRRRWLVVSARKSPSLQQVQLGLEDFRTVQIVS